MNAAGLVIASLVLLAAGLALVAVVLLQRERQRHRTGALLDRAIHGHTDSVPAPADAFGDSALPQALPLRDEDAPAAGRELPVHWLGHPLGRLLVAAEDRRLVLQCGVAPVPAQLLFLVSRLVLTPLLPLLVWLLPGAVDLPGGGVLVAVAIGLGFMLPKWWLVRRAAARRRRVAHELPLFVDLLRLLQGVGLGLDQGLQVMADDFGQVMRVLGPELVLANRQYRQGRTRVQSLQRLATLYDNDDLAALVALIVQTDRHGGAVQEPLRQFGERLREQRRADMKGRIGRITVQMTGVMVTTLLPALVIVTAGPGFLAVIRALGGMAK